MLTLMAIWNAKKGIIYITNMDKRLELLLIRINGIQF